MMFFVIPDNPAAPQIGPFETEEWANTAGAATCGADRYQIVSEANSRRKCIEPYSDKHYRLIADLLLRRTLEESELPAKAALVDEYLDRAKCLIGTAQQAIDLAIMRLILAGGLPRAERVVWSATYFGGYSPDTIRELATTARTQLTDSLR